MTFSCPHCGHVAEEEDVSDRLIEIECPSCGKVFALASAVSVDQSDDGTDTVSETPCEKPPAPEVAKVIGPYKILQLIGRGEVVPVQFTSIQATSGRRQFSLREIVPSQQYTGLFE